MRLSLFPDWAQEDNISHRVRELRFFESTFKQAVVHQLGDHGIASRTDLQKLHGAFLAWVDNFHVTREIADADRRDFVCYAAGRMLAELFRHAPVTITALPKTIDPDLAEWPEGALYSSYCLGVALSVLAQEFSEAPDVTRAVDDRRVWQSMRENITDNPDYAIPFLDLLIGQTPNWSHPSLPERRPAVKAKRPLPQ